MSVMNSMYLLHYRPVADINNQIINELTILIVSYSMLILGDVSIEFEGKKFLGRAVLVSVSLNTLYNMSLAAISTIKELYFSFRDRKVTKASDIQTKQDIAKILKDYPNTFPSIDFLEMKN